MSVAFDHRDPGTLEQTWADAAPWRSAPPLRLTADAVVVLAAHPDDETLGAGGLVARCHAVGIPVTVVVVTDGGASHPLLGDERDLPRERRSEAVEAVADLAPSAALVFLGFDDGRVDEQRADISERVNAVLSGFSDRAVLVAAPWWGDGHRDHRVLGEIALDLGAPKVEVVGYPIWLWHWATPDAVDTSGWRVLHLTDAERTAKSGAIARHRTQVEPLSPLPGGEAIVHDGMRAHFLRDDEVYVGAPPTEETSADIAAFDDFFRRHDDPWGFESRWYEARKRSVLRASLPGASFARALELGCANGVLTAELADRCDDLLAVDASEPAVRAASDRTRDLANVRVEQFMLPGAWPDGRFDLVIVSELAYYLGADDRELLARRIRGSLTDDGVVVACHWRRRIDDAATTGDRVHHELSRSLGLHRIARHEEADFVLDVFATAPGSVAEREGLA